MTPLEVWLSAVSALSFGLFALLGITVTRAPVLWRIDARAARLLGQATRTAACFTLSARAKPLFVLAVSSIVAVAALRADVTIALSLCAAQAVSQAMVEIFKNVFRRKRPDAWLVREELGFSYPSGHACTAAVFFGSWLIYVLLHAPHPAKTIAAAAIAIWIVGIDWSRVALGAHYPTDVLGGSLFGLGWLTLLWELLLHFGAAAAASQ